MAAENDDAKETTKAQLTRRLLELERERHERQQQIREGQGKLLQAREQRFGGAAASSTSLPATHDASAVNALAAVAALRAPAVVDTATAGSQGGISAHGAAVIGVEGQDDCAVVTDAVVTDADATALDGAAAADGADPSPGSASARHGGAGEAKVPAPPPAPRTEPPSRLSLIHI